MADITIVLDPTSPLSLQRQLRQKIVDAIDRGVLCPGRKLPSSRSLAERLGVSRNTVALAYDTLLAEGHLVSRQRSGIFVSPDMTAGRIAVSRRPATSPSLLMEKLQPVAEDAWFRYPHNWQQYPYPFLDGRIEPGLTPLAEWREAIRLACSRQDASSWSSSDGEQDDPMLLNELLTKILPARGISAVPDDILLCLSARHSLHMLVTLLVRNGTPVRLEEPVDAEIVQTLEERHADIGRFDPACTKPLPPGVIVITSARHGIEIGSRVPAALLKAIEACDGILIEHDMPPDVNDAAAVAPAIYAGSTGGRVIYIGNLSPVVACGIPPAVIVADAAFTERLRQLRCMSGATPEFILQRAWAYFIGLGHYASALHRARRVLGEKRQALRDALNHYLHELVSIETLPGASAYWVRLLDGRDAGRVARQATHLGVLIRPGQMAGARDAFCMGVSGIDVAQIRPGVRHLSRLIRGDLAAGRRQLRDEVAGPLDGKAIRRAIAGKALLYSTVYGEPCTIQVLRSGELIGVSGHAKDDCDRGRWWIEGDRWFRQWQNWAYAECSGYAVVIDGEQIRWYDDDGVLVDMAVITRAPRRR